MINLLRAEIFKAQKNTVIAIFTIGTLPALAFVLLNMLAILGATGLWITDIAYVNPQEQVILALLFANQFLAQGLIIIFTAVVFGGESRWNTWKNILPRTHRTQIILSKFVLIVMAIFFSTQLMALLTFIGSWEVATFNNVPFVNEAWGDSGHSFVIQYLWTSLAISLNFMMAAIYTALVAIQTKSVSTGIVMGLIITFADSLSQAAFALISRILSIEFIAAIPNFLPNKNMQNILSWITGGETIYRWSLTVSTLILVSWIICGIGLSIYLFERQDIH